MSMYYYDSDDWLFDSMRYVINKKSLEQDYTFIYEIRYIMNNIK